MGRVRNVLAFRLSPFATTTRPPVRLRSVVDGQTGSPSESSSFARPHRRTSASRELTPDGTWCALVVMLVGVGLRLGSMHRAIGVFRWGIDRIQLQVFVPDVDHVVPQAGGDDHGPIVLNLVALVNTVA